MVAQLRADFPDVRLAVADAVGESEDVLNAVARYCIDAQGTR
jgi:hypothetical protein